MFPIGLRTGPDGALYITLPALGADDGSGQIVRVEVPGAAAAAEGPAPRCLPLMAATPRPADEATGTPTP